MFDHLCATSCRCEHCGDMRSCAVLFTMVPSWEWEAEVDTTQRAAETATLL